MTAIAAPARDTFKLSDTRFVALALLVASSSYVVIEPAPYDLFAIGLMVVLFVGGGLRLPTGLAVPSFLLGVLAIANFVPGMTAANGPRALFFLAVTVYLFMNWYLFVGLIYENPPKAIAYLWRGYLIAAAIAVTFGVAGYFHLVPNFADLLVAGRVKALFKDPNVYGPFLIPPILYLLTMIEGRTSPITKAAALGFCMVLVFGAFLSFSRAAWANMILSFGLFYLLRFLASRSAKYRVRTVVMAVVIGAFGIGVIAYAITQPEVSELFSKRARFIQRYDSVRFGTQWAALSEAATNPFGIGLGQSERTFNKATHNLYLRVIVENGWIGAAAFFGFVIVTMWRSLMFFMRETPVQSTFIVALAAALGCLGNSVVIDSLHWRHMWLLFAILWGVMLAYPPRPAERAPPAPWPT